MSERLVRTIPIYSHNSAIYFTLISSKAIFFGVKTPPKLLSMDANHTKRSVKIKYWRNSRTLWLVKQIPKVSQFLEILSKVPMAKKKRPWLPTARPGLTPETINLTSTGPKVFRYLLALFRTIMGWCIWVDLDAHCWSWVRPLYTHERLR